MKLKWYDSYSSNEPLQVDYESSPTTVYFNKDIKTIVNDNGSKSFAYKQCKLTREQFTQYVVNNFDTVSNCIDDFGELISVNSSAIDEAMTMLSDIQERLTKLEEK